MIRKEERLYNELLAGLAGSTGAERVAWAKQIANCDMDLKELLPLLYADKKTAYRFSWMLSDVGIAYPQKLFSELPGIFERRKETDILNFEQQFVKYWRLCGVPEENKGEAIDMMFRMLTDPKESVHIKTVALDVLYELTKEYPELKNELRLCIEETKEEQSSFKQKSERILKQL